MSLERDLKRKDFLKEAFKSDDGVSAVADADDEGIDPTDIDVVNDEEIDDETKKAKAELEESKGRGKKKSMREEDEDLDEEDEDDLEEDEDEDELDEDEDLDEEDEDDLEEDEDEDIKVEKKSFKKVDKNEVDVSEHVEALVSSDPKLSASFKNKVKTIFEAAVIETVNKVLEKRLSEEVVRLDEERDEYFNFVAEKANEFISLSIQDWIEENQVSVERTLKSQISESFLLGLRDLLQEHYIEVPESKRDLVGELSTKVEQLSEKLDKSVTKTARAVTLLKEAADEIEEMKKAEILREETENLTTIQKKKISMLAENINSEDLEDYREKVRDIKEAYGEKPSRKARVVLEEQDEVKFEDDETVSDSGMKSVTDYMDKLFGKK